MANIFDILMDAKLAVKNNIYLSWGYMTYQVNLTRAIFYTWECRSTFLFLSLVWWFRHCLGPQQLWWSCKGRFNTYSVGVGQSLWSFHSYLSLFSSFFVTQPQQILRFVVNDNFVRKMLQILESFGVWKDKVWFEILDQNSNRTTKFYIAWTVFI